MRRDDRNLRRQREELVPVLPRQVGHRADLALVPQVVVGERWDVGHVDAGAHDRAAAGERLERLRHERAGGGEDDRGVERLGRKLVAAPAQVAPSERANAWVRSSPVRVKA